MTASKTFDVASSGSQVLKFNGHPQYDALRVEFDSANSTGTDVDVTFKVDSETYDDAPAFGSFDATVKSTTAVDASTGDPHVGNTAMSRTVAVEIDETSGVGGVEGTVYAHNTSDPAQNADSFANR